MAIVVGVPVTVFLERHLRALWARVIHGRIDAPLVFNDFRLLSTLAAEVVMAVALLWWLGRRGWRTNELLGKLTLRDLVSGAALWCTTFAIVRGTYLMLGTFAPGLFQAAREAPLQGELSWPVYLAALAINPIFEEMLWLGYAIPTLTRQAGLGIAVIVSIGLRAAVHFPQGAWAVTYVLPVGLVWTAYFLWRQRLWPVVVAHIINNAFGLGNFVGTST
jgi:membrane protease YdiL (CAAX protease family)